MVRAGSEPLIDRVTASSEQERKGAGNLRLHATLSLAERQQIVADAFATSQQDAESLLRRQRARFDACAAM